MRTYPLQADPWIYQVNGDAALYIRFYEEILPDERAILILAMGGMPSVSISADLSGRHWARRIMIMKDFVSGILSSFDGLANDGYSDHHWTLKEVISGRTNEQGQQLEFFGGFNPDGNPATPS